eukprot:m.141042 g.141042  ORF g.141042 m.141042 type:complete len:267 (+) comp11550_c0_seq2:3-803(+)
MREKRSRLSQSTLADGRVLVCGGEGDSVNRLNSAEIYDTGNLVAVAGKPIVLPPTPSTEGMLQGEKATALREWLATAEGLLLAEGERVIQLEKKLQQVCDERVAQAHHWFEVEVQKLAKERQRRIEVATVQRDQQLACYGTVAQTAAEEQIAKVRRQTEEAERLAALLENPAAAGPAPAPAAAPAAPGPAIARPEEHYDMTFNHDVMTDPVLTACACGTSFERGPLEAWLKDHDSCPKCGADLPVKVVIPNTSLKNMIRDWQQPMQ